MNKLLAFLTLVAATAAAPAVAQSAPAATPAPAVAAPAPAPAPAVDPIQAAGETAIPPTVEGPPPNRANDDQGPMVAVPPGQSTADAAAPNAEQDLTKISPAANAGTRPTPGIGQPDGRMGIQEQVTPLGRDLALFHDALLFPTIVGISLFVMLLLGFAMIRFRRSANPVPSTTTHHTALEVAWTLIPVLILVAFAVPSISLIAQQYSPPRADLTVKVIGNQWYWTYQYPDNGADPETPLEIVSNMLPDAEADRRGEPRLLAVDNRMVVPVNSTVKIITTSNDVIHSFGVPSLWVKIDAIPGRLNEYWFKIDRPGVYYGQCYELCGARHPYMPIAIEAVEPARFNAWVLANGGTVRNGPAPQRTFLPDDTTSTDDAGGILPAPDREVDAVVRPQVSEQSLNQPRVAQ